MAVALELPFDEPAPAGDSSRHLGPAEAFDGGRAHVGGSGGFVYIWYSVPQDERPCPFCNLPVDESLRCVAIMPDGSWRWAHNLCAVSAKGGQSDMAIGAPWKRREWPPCSKCGGRWREDHLHDSTGVWCTADDPQEYERNDNDRNDSGN